MKFILETLKHNKDYAQITKAIKNKQTPVVTTGLSGVHKTIISASLAKEHGKKILFLCADESECNRITNDFISVGTKTAFYPARDFNLRETASISYEFERQRLEALNKIRNDDCTCVVATIDAALQYTIPQKELEKRSISFSVGDEFPQKKLLDCLVACGYQICEQIDGIGQFSHRGGIVDFFAPGMDKAVRVEFWGDEIDSISLFDTDSQRRDESLENVSVFPSIEVIPRNNNVLVKKIRAVQKSIRGKQAVKAKEILEKECVKLENGLQLSCIDKYISLVYDEVSTLFDYFASENSIVVFSEGSKLKEKVRSTQWQWHEDVKDLLAEGVLCKGLSQYGEDWVYALKKAEEFPSLHLDNFARGTYEIPTKTLVNMNVKQLSLWGGSTQLLKEDLDAYLNRKFACVVLAGTEKAGRVLAADLRESGLPTAYFDDILTVQKGTIAVLAGSLSAGFEIPESNFALLSHGRVNTGSKSSSKKKKAKNSQDIYSLAELSVGDYVVHNVHGIGIFLGIHKVEVRGVLQDYIKIEYAKKDTLYVPVIHLDMVGKYIGPRDDSTVKIHKLGGAEWQKAKTKVRSAVKDIAKELIKLYAERMKQKGFAFPEDDEWQRDFEAHFEYNETDDQLRSIAEIKNDMESIIPMDRLLCGDVGFGKTEVALRAAFKCVTAGKQCAILVPTTILAWQHYQSILKRMEGFPIKVELLSRFRTGKQQNQILKELKHGDIDIIVGTHRLVSKDVEFRDLGLAIVDEEQRFGVAQKEKLKTVCKNTDYLTLSATPIPRTLNMAMSGIRDMSVIEEAPHDRHPVHTYVLEYDFGIIIDAIKKEMRRGGQIYYLHNDVASISSVAARIQAAIPEISIGIGHGKMDEKELSEVWRQLMEHEIDLLVCTTIIETGVDVPNANTLIIDNADKMGLSQLHQIRGRVGRSNRRAYAYFTYNQNKVLSEIAQKRLNAIREFTEFGSGFKIAMRDMEIRGAGNILGGEQHGHMESVGYDMYIKLLNQAVALMKGEELPPEKNVPSVDMPVQAHIPESYISSIQHRLEIYRRIADIETVEDSVDVVDELIDRFGEPPKSVQGLIDIALLRNMASHHDIKFIKQQNDDLLLYLEKIDMGKIKKLITKFKGQVMLNAGDKPHILIKLNKRAGLEVLEDVLKIMDLE